MVVVHIPPDLTGILMVIIAAHPVIALQHVPGLLIGKGLQHHYPVDPVLLIGTDIDIKYIGLAFQDLRCAAAQDNAGIGCQLPYNLCLIGITVGLHLVLNIGPVIHRNAQPLGELSRYHAGPRSVPPAHGDH